MLELLFNLILSASAALAAPTNAPCPGVGGVVQEVVFLKHQDCSLARSLANIFNSLATLSDEAPRVTLVFGGPANNASFDNGQVIQVPYQLVFQDSYGNPFPMAVQSLYATAAHEYGHAVFNQKLKRTLPSEYLALLKALEKISLRKIAALKGGHDPEVESDLLKVMESATYQHFRQSLTAVAEFYADTLAVYYFQDKSAIFSALYYKQMTDLQYQVVRLRDFAREPDPQWSSLMMEDHGKLAMTRAYVGKNLWPKKPQDIPRLEKRVASVSVKNVIRRLSLEEDSLYREDSDPETLNSNIIKALLSL